MNCEHKFGKYEWVRTETCDEDGLMRKVCEICGAEETLFVAPKGHCFGFWSEDRPASIFRPARYARVCSECGFVEYENHGKRKKLWNKNK